MPETFKKTVHVLACQDGGENPVNDPQYQGILRLLPTLKDEIASRIFQVYAKGGEIVRRTEIDLPTNESIMSDNTFVEARARLRELMEELLLLNEGKPPVMLIQDQCFTNALVYEMLMDIFGEDDISKFVHRTIVSYESYSEEWFADLQRHIGGNSILIVGGSFSDTYSMDYDIYYSPFARIIQDAASDAVAGDNNVRVIGVCFGQQLVANLIGMGNPDKDKVIATIRGDAQFGPSACKMEDMRYVPGVFREAFSGITHDLEVLEKILLGLKAGMPMNQYSHEELMSNTRFAANFTRTGHVHFDLLGQGGTQQIVPLVRDEISGEIVGWGTKNGRVIGVQFHPEMSFWRGNAVIEQALNEIVDALRPTYGDAAELVRDNFDVGDSDVHSIGPHFYLFALLAFARDMVKTNAVGYPSMVRKVMQEVQNRVRSLVDRVDHGLAGTKNLLSQLSLDDIDRAGKLDFVASIDWKVNRGIEEWSEILGLKNVAELTASHMEFLKGYGYASPFFFCDWGAGNGTLIRELHDELLGSDIVFYGVGDRIYFDLYQGIKQSKFVEHIPENIIRLFVQKLIELYNAYVAAEGAKGRLTSRFGEIIDALALHPDDPVFVSSMFLKKTEMFSFEAYESLSPDEKAFLSSPDGHQTIVALKNDLKANLYKFFYGFFERIYLSDFNNYQPENSVFSRVNFQVAIRSTSHVDNDEYRQITRNYIRSFASPGAMYVDNGVHRSYTSVPRIPELMELQEEFSRRIKIDLVYDTKTNYYCSAIIQSLPFQGAPEIAEHLSEDKVLVSVGDAYNATYTRLEYFLRNFIVSNFKDYRVFWDFNRDIVQCLQQMHDAIRNKKYYLVRGYVVNLINSMVEDVNVKHSRAFSPIDERTLDLYVNRNGETIRDILDSPFSCPDWLNDKVQRRN